jgi:hypothetical protein
MKKYLNRFVRKSYDRHSYRKFGFKIPFYLNLPFKMELCMYAMNMDWDSLRIKIESRSKKNFGKILCVIKKGIY